MKFGEWVFKNNKECNPAELDNDSLLRWDNIVLKTKQDIYSVCTDCLNQKECIETLTWIRGPFLDIKK